MAVLHDTHRNDQFVAKIGMAVAHIAERRERAEHIPFISCRAVVGFHAPEREQNRALDAELLFDRVEGLRPLLALGCTALDAAARNGVTDIGADRVAVFRLPL